MLDRSLSVSDILRTTARALPSKEAIVDERGSLSFRDLDVTVDNLARTLRKSGVSRGDRVAYLLWNQRELYQSYFAIARLGALTIALNFRLAAEEIAYQLLAAECRVIIVDAELLPLAEQAIDLAKVPFLPIVVAEEVASHQMRFRDAISGEFSDTAALPVVSGDEDSGIWFTSGTTGKPKGAIVKHRSAVATATLCAWSLKFTRDMRALAVAPLFHRGAMENIALSLILVGATQFLFKKLSAAQTLGHLERLEINVAFIVPTMAWQLLREPAAQNLVFPHITHWISASAPLPPALEEEVRTKFQLSNGVINFYGITEMLYVSLCPPNMLPKKPGTAGLPAPCTQVAIYDERKGFLPAGTIGEIIISGPTSFSRYLDNEQATREAMIEIDGAVWYKSGDLGSIDEDGYLSIRDRKKDMIISGGENIYSAEVELALSENPAVSEVAVVGIADEKWGEIVVAAIVKRAAGSLDREDVIKRCAGLASYKRPRELVFLEALPRNAFGKIQKDKLRLIVEEHLRTQKRPALAS